MSAVPHEPQGMQSTGATSLDRRIRMLRTAMGPAITAALEDPDVAEIMLNPDGSLWIDRLSSGRAPADIRITPEDGERIIRLVAAHVRAEVHAGHPLLTAELPETGERFEGILPPASTGGPAFALRKRAIGVIPLTRYVADGILNQTQAEFLRQAVHARQNILIAGGTSTGKTTLSNALLAIVAETGDRVIVGEVRGGEALDMVKVWGTGHPGGIATIHANTAHGALLRLEQLILEVARTPPRALIAEAINVVVFIAGRGLTRYVGQIERVTGFDSDGYQLEDALAPALPLIDSSHRSHSSTNPGDTQ